ncbi:MAG: hypothetical protein MUO99_04260, partial [Dehalococcoidales bacterium]|nr:hypothetical protein [Dehalococcoidales bacterium]
MADKSTALKTLAPGSLARRTQGSIAAYPQLQEIERRIALVDLVFEKMVGPGIDPATGKATSGIDYGTVPGIAKPFLFRAGAERLALYFGIHIDMDILDLSDRANNLFSYRVITKAYDSKGNYLGMGAGACSSKESKYKYRWVAYSGLPSSNKTGD